MKLEIKIDDNLSMILFYAFTLAFTVSTFLIVVLTGEGMI
jgi:hypothetical protein